MLCEDIFELSDSNRSRVDLVVRHGGRETDLTRGDRYAVAKLAPKLPWEVGGDASNGPSTARATVPSPHRNAVPTSSTSDRAFLMSRSWVRIPHFNNDLPTTLSQEGFILWENVIN
jgi:hypothetical protein